MEKDATRNNKRFNVSAIASVALTLALVLLKAADVLAFGWWEWKWIICPLWLPIAAVIALYTFAFLCNQLAAFVGWLRWRRTNK